MSYRAPLGQAPAYVAPQSQADCRPGEFFTPASGSAPARCGCAAQGATAPAPRGMMYRRNPNDVCSAGTLVADPAYMGGRLAPTVVPQQRSAFNNLRPYLPFVAMAAGAGALAGYIGARQPTRGRAAVAGAVVGMAALPASVVLTLAIAVGHGGRLIGG